MNGHALVPGRRVRSMSVAWLAAAALVGACSTSSGSIAPPPTAPPGGAVIVAEDQHFDRSRLDLPAGVSVPLLFENRDASLHNVAIVDASGVSVFTGEIFGGKGDRAYAIPALPVGTYAFRCDVHPDMHGTLVAGAAISGF
jgi:plastocyanin